MADRAGYTLSLYAIDISPSMGATVVDNGKEKTKLDLVKEFVARKCEPKISSGRKTEAVGILSFGGRTNNQAHRAWVTQNPEDEDPPYSSVSCDVAIQTVRPKTVEVVMNIELGDQEGNPVSALMVGLDMIHIHKHTKSWALEIVLLTDGESSFKQDEYEEVMQRLEDMGVKLVVIGIGFQPLLETVDKTKTRNKRLSEKFWRTFYQMLHDKLSPATSSDAILPSYETFDSALHLVRQPHPSVVNGTVSSTFLFIGSTDINLDEAIVIPIKYSKATMKARAPALSKAWKPAMDLQGPPLHSGAGASQAGSQYRPPASSQLFNSLAEQSRSNDGDGIKNEQLAAMISADVKHHSNYVIKRVEPPLPTATQEMSGSHSRSQVDYGMEGLQEERADSQFVKEEEEEEVVAKEDIVKAWRFGSTWVPMEKDTFEPLQTQQGVEILGFFPRDNIKRHQLMGEVRFVWPDIKNPKAQVQFSSLVEAMALREMCAVVRWVLRENGEPTVGLCVPEFEYPGEDRRLDYMFWVKLPFAEDEHNFWFPSLNTVKTASGKVLTEHPLLPTKEQCSLMDDLVAGMDLDALAEGGGGDDEDEPMDAEPWFECSKSYNPVIHRIKEAIFHASLTPDLDSDPLPPPNPELVKYFNTPEEIGQTVEKVTMKLKDALDIKKVPPKTRKKVNKEGLREDEGFIDIDELFSDPVNPSGTQVKKTPKKEPVSPIRATKEDNAPESSRKPHFIESDSEEDSPRRPAPKSDDTPSKPKRGRLVSNEHPLEDFNKLIEGEGDVFRKAIQDLGAVVKENVEASFSRSAFPLAIECLSAMRATALTYEEVETYNDFLDDLEKFVKAPKFKHHDFWDHFEKAGTEVGKISAEEAEEALGGY